MASLLPWAGAGDPRPVIYSQLQAHDVVDLIHPKCTGVLILMRGRNKKKKKRDRERDL